MTCKKAGAKGSITTREADKYRGVNVDRADGNRSSKQLEKQDVNILNNNPRNDDM